MSVHLPDLSLEQLALGKLSDEELWVAEQHLETCADCRTRAAEVTAVDDFVQFLSLTKSTWVEPGLPLLSISAVVTPSVSDTLSAFGSGADRSYADELPPSLVNHPKYQVVRKLGSGGMGAVWLAKHAIMNRLVALKVVAPHLLGRESNVERFQREIRAVAGLHHPNIVSAYDAEFVGSTYVMVMEYVAGRSLTDLVADGPIPPTTAAKFVRDVARGLSAAHEAGLVHRDIKPSNLMLAEDGCVKILDFGLVAPCGESEGRLTATTMVLGTPDYISPEQADGPLSADARSDIYSLGCTFFHLVTGHVPYPCPTALAKIDAHRNKQAGPRHPTDLPPLISATIRKMMAKDPADRYQTAREVVFALDRIIDDVNIAPPTRTSHTPARRTRWAIAAGLLLALGTISLAGVIHRIQTDRGELVIETTDDDVEVLVKQGGKLVTIYDPKSRQKLMLRSGEYEFELNGKPTGLKLDIDKATLKRGDTIVAKIDRVAKAEPKRNEVRSTEPQDEVWRFEGFTESVHTVALSPDGKIVAAGGGGKVNNLGSVFEDGKDFVIRIWDVQTGKLIHRLMGHTAPVTKVAFSPDGKKLASCAGGADKTLRLWDLETGQEMKALRNQPTSLFGLAFSPDGKTLALAGWGTLSHWDIAGRKLVKEFARFPRSTNAWSAVSFSPDGKYVVAGGWEALVVYDAHSGEIHRSIEQPGLYRLAHVEYSADGSRIVSMGCADGTLDSSCVVWNAATGKEVRRLSGRRGTFASDDGSTLFVGDAMGRPTVLWDVVSEQRLATYTGYVQSVTAQAVSIKMGVAVTGGNDGTVRLYKLPGSTAVTPPRGSADTLNLSQPAPNLKLVHKSNWLERHAYFTAISPDGRYYGATGEVGGEMNVGARVWEMESGKEVGTFPGAGWLTFSADGKSVYTYTHVDSMIRSWDLKTRKQTAEFTGHTNGLSSLVAMADGKRLVSASADRTVRIWDVKNQKEVTRRQFDDAHVLFVTEGVDESTIVACDYHAKDPVIRLIDVNTGEITRKWVNPGKSLVYDIRVSRDGKGFVTLHRQEIRIWDVARDEPVRTISLTKPLSSYAISADLEYLLASFALESEVRLINLKTGRTHGIGSVHHESLGKLSFSRDGKYACVSVTAPSEVYIFELPSADIREGAQPPKHAGPMSAHPTPAQDRTSLLRVTDFREAHGADLGGLRAWLAELPPGFRPVDIAVRSGSNPSRFDAVAIRDDRDVKFDPHLELDKVVFNRGADFDAMTAAGWSLRIVCPYTDGKSTLRQHIWFRDSRPWIAMGLPMRETNGRFKEWKRQGMRPVRFHIDGADTGRGNVSRPLGVILEPDLGLDWEVIPELTAAELSNAMEVARKQGRRPDALGGFGTQKDRTYAVSLVPNPTNLEWFFQTGMTVSQFETAVEQQRKLGRRPVTIQSESDGDSVWYTAVWIEYSPRK